MSEKMAGGVPTIDTAKKLGLTEEEYGMILQIMGRTPNFTELSIYAVMWSEHCSYKSSIKWLKTLPRKGGRLLVEAGQENAGLVDIGDGWACSFKIESHNHPSAIEPYQGAATGVGGIQRDIFTMGARPICSLNSLRFGRLDSARSRHIMKGVVKGIGDYGNAFGVPTVAGEIYFEECYEANPLVNAMSVGIVKTNETLSAIAYGVGNPVFIVGSATGKDGIHGATFASKDMNEESADELPSVQVGDPFQEKLLLEATLELAKTGTIIGMQDMGAAGITCSTSEMSAKGNSGMKIYLDKVPTRQENMKPFEILLSESQERMLVVLEKGKEEEALNIFKKWGLHAAWIGEVTDTGILEYFMMGEKVAEVNADSLVLGGGAPVFDKPFSEPQYIKEMQPFAVSEIPEQEFLQGIADILIREPNIASKGWVTKQYDSMVGIANLSTNRPSDATVVRILGTDKALAVTVDCNPRYVYADPYIGAQIAVAEAARNLSCTGAVPLAVTNNLNFGNPNNPEVYWQFVEAVKGMGDACRAFDTPVTGGNVSLYNQYVNNEGKEVAVYPTPTIGMVGLLEKPEHQTSMFFDEIGLDILLLGKLTDDINSSQYLIRYLGIEKSSAPYFKLEEEMNMQKSLRELIHKGMIKASHDVSEGGICITLLEMGFFKEFGFDIKIPGGIRRDAFLFGEGQGRVVVAVNPADTTSILTYCKQTNVEVHKIGNVTEGNISIDHNNWRHISEWKQMYTSAIERYL